MPNNIIKGQVIPINQINIDTDSIIPKQYLKAITKTGFGPFLFDSWRYKDPGDLSTKNKRRINEEFILNKEPFSSGNILIVNNNFGCGSSREHAVWALKDFGIQVVISTSFADIFSRNSFKNELLLIIITKKELEGLFNEISKLSKYCLTINIQNQTITTPNNLEINFDINDSDKDKIINGYDDIELTLKHKNKIQDYEDNMKKVKPWLFESSDEKK